MSGWHPDFVTRLKQCCGDASVRTDPASLMAYENDGLGFHRCRPDCVVIPRNSDELKDVVRLCRGHDFPYTIRAAGTSLSGGPVAEQGGLIVHVSRLKSILEVNAENLYCVVEPGVVLNRLNDHLESYGLFYPPDPSSGFTSTLGGNVAENAGGIRCFRYGVTANYVLGLEVMLPSGDIVQLGGPAGGLGPSGGCDWKTVFVGSEGMLGVITKIWLRLKPIPERIWTFLGQFRTVRETAAMIVDLVHCPATPVAIEMIDEKMIQLLEASPMACGLDPECVALLTEIDGPAELVGLLAEDISACYRKHNAVSLEKTDDKAKRLNLWRARKVGGGLLGQISPDVMIQDAVLPRTDLAEILEMIYREADKEGIVVTSTFHAGDGNLHPSFLFDARNPDEVERVKKLGTRLMEEVVARGGTLSGEHGIGSDKINYVSLVFGEREIAVQRALLDCFNPDHQLNPEKAFPQRSFVGCCAPPRQS